MKRHLLIIAACLALAAGSRAQITVNQNGRVNMGSYTTLPPPANANWVIGDFMGVWMGNTDFDTRLTIKMGMPLQGLYDEPTSNVEIHADNTYNILQMCDPATGVYDTLIGGGYQIVYDDSPEDPAYCSNPSQNRGLGDMLALASGLDGTAAEALPQLICEGRNGRLMVRSQAALPLLVEAYQALLAEKTDLDRRMTALAAGTKGEAGAVVLEGQAKPTAQTAACRIAGCSPNPFRNSTAVETEIPETVAAAKVRVTDAAGTVVAEREIGDRGRCRTRIDAHGWASGMYFCSLIADRKIVGTIKINKR